jgi:EmrB/QacA subfamily drug resistance transporter
MEIEKTSNNTKITVLIITTILAFVMPFMLSAVNIALPKIGDEFGMNAIILGWVVTSFMLASASLLVPFGRLADIYGRKKIFTLGTIIFSLGSIFCIFTTSIPLFIGSRVIQGIGCSMILGTSIAMLTSVYPPEKKGSVLGINAATVYLGISLGPFLGGLLTDHTGWRSIFIFGFILSFMTVVIVLWRLRDEWSGAKGERFDYAGSIIFAASLIALISGMSSLPDILGVLLLVGGIIGFFIFVAWENHAQSPLLNLNLFKSNKIFILSNTAALISYAATYAITFLLSLYLQYNKGLSPSVAGLILVTTPAVQSIFSPIAGRLSDRMEPRTLASAGMAVTMVGIGLLIFLDGNTPIAFLLVSLLILGFGFGLFISPNTNAIMSSINKQWYGVASATLATSRQIGIMLSMGIVMVIFAIFIGPVQITPAYYDVFARSMRIIFIIFTSLCLVGIFASLARGKVRQEHAKGNTSDL